MVGRARPTQSYLRLRKVGSIRYGVYAREAHGFGEHPADWPWLVLDDAHGRIPETRWLRSSVDRPQLRLRSRDTRDLARAAAEGWGVAVLPAPLAERHGLLELRTTELVRPLWLVTHEALADVARVRVVLDWVAAVCARVQSP